MRHPAKKSMSKAPFNLAAEAERRLNTLYLGPEPAPYRAEFSVAARGRDRVDHRWRGRFHGWNKSSKVALPGRNESAKP